MLINAKNSNGQKGRRKEELLGISCEKYKGEFYLFNYYKALTDEMLANHATKRRSKEVKVGPRGESLTRNLAHYPQKFYCFSLRGTEILLFSA